MDDQDDRTRLITKDELNLAEFPFALPCHRAPKDIQRIEITEPGVDKDGRSIQKIWTVHPSGYGLPLAIDEEVFLGLMHLLYRSDFRERTIYFTQHSLFQILGWNASQRSYDRLQLCLLRLRGSTIACKQTFWDNNDRCFLDTGFSLIDSYGLYRRGDKKNAHDQPFISQVTFGEFIFKSFKDGFIKTLDLNLYLSLKSALARKLFRLLDKKRHRGEVFEIELMRLAHRLAMTDCAYPSIVKKQLERGAHAELEAIGFLKCARYIRRGRSLSIQYTLAPKQNWHLPSTPARLPEANPLVLELISRGITPDVAHALLKEHGEKRVADQLEYFDHLRSINSFLVSKSPAGFLRTSIEKDFGAPTGYISRAERQRRKDEEVEARRRDRELAEAAARIEQEREQEFQALWEALSSNERTQMEAEVLLTLNSFSRKAYEKEKAQGREGPGHHTLRTGLQKLLAQRHELAGASTPQTAGDPA